MGILLGAAIVVFVATIFLLSVAAVGFGAFILIAWILTFILGEIVSLYDYRDFSILKRLYLGVVDGFDIEDAKVVGFGLAMSIIGGIPLYLTTPIIVSWFL